MTKSDVFSESQTKKVKIFSGATAFVASKLAERSSRHVQMCAICIFWTPLSSRTEAPLPSPGQCSSLDVIVATSQYLVCP